MALFAVRVNYYLLKGFRFLRLSWVTYGSVGTSSVWIGLSKQPLFGIITSTFRILFSKSVCFAFLFACLSLEVLQPDLSYYLPKVQELLQKASRTTVDVGAILSSLPALVALVTLVPIIFFFYFYSQKREVRKIIDKENSQCFHEVVLLYEKLFVWIVKHIYALSVNFDYVISMQDVIVDLVLEKEIPNYTALNRLHYYRSSGVKNYDFIEMQSSTDLRDIITELYSERLQKFARMFAVRQYDVWQLYHCFEFYNEDTIERINRVFYTQSGMIRKIENRRTHHYDSTEDSIQQHKKQEFALLAESIYDSLQLLYTLRRASISLRRYLYSSRAERLVLKALNKGK